MAILEEDGTTVPSAWDVARTPSGRTPSSQPIESSSLSKIAYRVRLCRGFFPIKSSTGLWNDTETTYHTNIQGKTILHYQPHAMRNQTPSKHPTLGTNLPKTHYYVNKIKVAVYHVSRRGSHSIACTSPKHQAGK